MFSTQNFKLFKNNFKIKYDNNILAEVVTVVVVVVINVSYVLVCFNAITAHFTYIDTNPFLVKRQLFQCPHVFKGTL